MKTPRPIPHTAAHEGYEEAKRLAGIRGEPLDPSWEIPVAQEDRLNRINLALWIEKQKK